MWATDASYFRVVGGGYYYMVAVMDDYSRSILAWKLQLDMTSDSLIQVVPLAVDATGMTEVPLEDRTRLPRETGRNLDQKKGGESSDFTMAQTLHPAAPRVLQYCHIPLDLSLTKVSHFCWLPTVKSRYQL